MSTDRNLFLQQLVTGETVSMVPGMLVNEPLTVWGIEKIRHPIDPDASHIGDVFLKEAAKGWQHHIFAIDAAHLSEQVAKLLEGGHYLAGFGFQLQKRIQTAQWRT
jgi:hypothetical protein